MIPKLKGLRVLIQVSEAETMKFVLALIRIASF